MIIESIIAWFLSVLGYFLSLLPENGTLFNTVPDISTTFIKSVTMLNGYFPIVETGQVFIIMLAVGVSMLAIQMIFGIYNTITKLIP